MAGSQTPATRALANAGVSFQIHEYHHDPGAEAYGLEAVEALGVDAVRVFKTLVVLRADSLVVCIVPVAEKLALKTLGKHVAMAPPARAEAATGYVLGGISPLGQKRRLPTLLDASAGDHATLFVSGGRRGLEIELAPDDLIAQTGAELRDLT